MGFTLGPRRRPPSLRRPPELPCNATKFGLKKEHFGVFHHFGAFALKVGTQKTPKGPKIPQKTPKSPQNPIDFPPSPTPQIPPFPPPKFTIFNQIWGFLPQILGCHHSQTPPPKYGIIKNPKKTQKAPKSPKKPQVHPKIPLISPHPPLPKSLHFNPKFTIFDQIWAFLPQILGSPPSPPPPPKYGIPKNPKKPQIHPKMLTCPPRFAPAAPAAPHPNGCAPTSPPNLGEKRANLGKKGKNGEFE